ncbi:MAG: choice-of-anchor L domain-containing protein, partial [Saprospiraceae bacterium]|nr:choice-of-anchor L domain-containing protein [Saprospiraceae bacterium]
MKQLILLAFALLYSGLTLAQTPPANDNCDGLIPLGTAPTCPTTVFSNESATPSNIGTDNFPTCFNSGIAERDVWFSFQCPSTTLDWRITLTGIGANSIVNPEVAIYRGDCEFDGLSEYLCASAQLNDNTLYIDMLGLSPGATYFVRVSDYSATASPNSGEFTLCVDEIPPIVTIDGGSSSLCEGTIFDDGGPDGDYSSDDHVFTICPSSPTKCITFTLSYYNLDAGDFLNIYAGANTMGTLVQTIGGTTPINSGGGVCVQTQVASNCMTLQFLTDATVAFEGFQGTWECSPDVCPNTDAPITIDDDINQQDIEDFVKTPFTDVTVTNINCEQGAYGTFSYPSASNDLELERGLLLTSGDASSVANPGQIFLGSLLFVPGDPDLDAISTGLNTEDACVVEVDVYAATDELSFEYVFGSEEYPEFVNSDYNDIFALLISGPGIVGDPAIGGQKNLAVLPGSNTPVEINSVNNLENWEYYRDNTSGPNLVYDGLTSDFQGVKKSLTARQIVTPCNTYHLKFAIADRGDANYDSGVFLSKIQGGGPKVSLAFTSGIPYLVESCTNQPDQLVIQLSQPKDYAVSYLLGVGGTADNGTDYQITVPDTITFLPGQTQFTFPILPIADNLVEGIETITFSLTSNFGCGAVTFATVTVEIHDNIAVEIVGNDSLQVCEGFDLQLNVTGAAQYFWSPAGAVSNPFSASPILEQPANSLWLEVTGNVGICVDKDSVFVEVVKPDLSAMATTPTNICLGNSVQLQASSSNSTVVWSPMTGLTPPNAASPLATPTTSTTYVATVDYKGCVESIPITINVDTLFNPTLPPVVSLCQNYSVVLGPNLNNSSSTYLWSPTTGLSNSMVSNPVASPDVTTPYVLTTTSANGYCSATATVTVNVTAADVEILGDENYKICLGDTLNLAASLTPTNGTLTWEPAGIFTSTSVQTVLAHPSESVTVFARYQVNGCPVVDSVQIRVDSLPNLAVMKDEDKPVYCQGDTIYLTTPAFDTGEHPNPSYGWLPGPGQISQMPEKSFSLVIVASDSFTYRRHIKVGGCKDTTDVFIPVQKPPNLTATATPDKVCPGELIQLEVTADQPNLMYEWLSPADPTISCTECPKPTVRPAVSGFYQVK